MKRSSVTTHDRDDVHKKLCILDDNITQGHTKDATPLQDSLTSDTPATGDATAEDSPNGCVSESDMSLSDFSADEASVAGDTQREYASVGSTVADGVSAGVASAISEIIPNDASNGRVAESDLSVDEASVAGNGQPEGAPDDSTLVGDTSAAGNTAASPHGTPAGYCHDPTYPYNGYLTFDGQGNSIAYTAYYQQYQHIYQHVSQHPYFYPYPYMYPHPYHYLPSESSTAYKESVTTAASLRPDFDAMKASLRTIFVGNLPEGTRIQQVLDLIRTGIIESAKLLAPKHCAFISFVDANAALAFHSQAQKKKPRIHEQELTIGWGKATIVPPTVAQALEQGASRNVFLGGIDDTFTEDELLKDFSELGVVDKINIVREKAIAFVHLTHIDSAVKAVSVLQVLKPRYASLRVSYGKDRCAKYADLPAPLSTRLEAINAQGGLDSSSKGIDMEILTKEGQRTVYLGNIDPETTYEHLCNAIRGGILSNIKYQQSRHSAFVTFVDPAAATAFFEMASAERGFMVRGRKLKVGWGTNAALNLPLEVIQAFRTGATRNVYIGGVQGCVDVESLRKDFSEYGEVEQVNMLQEKDCAFVNFTNVLSAVKAVESIPSKPDYINRRISYGKDRCGNPMRERIEGAVSSGGHSLQKRKGTKTKDGKSADVKSSVDAGKSGETKGGLAKGSTSKPVSNEKAMNKTMSKAVNKAMNKAVNKAMIRATNKAAIRAARKAAMKAALEGLLNSTKK